MRRRGEEEWEDGESKTEDVGEKKHNTTRIKSPQLIFTLSRRSNTSGCPQNLEGRSIQTLQMPVLFVHPDVRKLFSMHPQRPPNTHTHCWIT